MGIFNRKNRTPLTELPAVLTKEDDLVNYNSVLDYLVGLSRAEYDKLQKVSVVYRNANKEAAKILGVKDEATVELQPPKPTDEEIDEGIDQALNGDIPFLDPDAPEAEKPKKSQAAEKKIEIK